MHSTLMESFPSSTMGGAAEREKRETYYSKTVWMEECVCVCVCVGRGGRGDEEKEGWRYVCGEGLTDVMNNVAAYHI